MSTLGDAIRSARKRAGLTQKALAWRLGLKGGSATVANWESGHRRPRPKNLRAVWEVCGTHSTFAPTPPAVDVARCITRVRKAAGLSKRQLARAVGVSPPSVTYWERGDRTPTMPHLVAIIRACGVTAVQFWDPDAESS